MKTLLLALIALFTANATAPSKAAVQEVTAAMESLKQAMLHRDGAALDKLLSDDLVYIHSAGQAETKAQFIQSIVSGRSKVTRLDFSGTVVRAYGDTALYQGGVDLYHSPTDIVHMNILHVWVKRSHGWKLVARQATRLTFPEKK
jgi:ketosteroid isomerase-like protein